MNEGYRFGRLALNLASRVDSPKLKVRTRMVVDFFIRPWKEHYRDLAGAFFDLYRQALESGNPEDAALSAYIYCTGSFRLGHDLRSLDGEMRAYGDSIRRLRQESALRLLSAYHQATRNLLGDADDQCELVGDVYNEKEMLPVHMEAGDSSAICVTYLNKLHVCYLFQDFEQALECADLADQYLHGVRGTPAVPVFYLYDSLARLALYDRAPPRDRALILGRVASNQRKMKKWAVHGPMNFAHKYWLVEAERNRVLGRDSRAVRCYDRAILLAREHQYMNEEALAYERAALFYLKRGRVVVAAAHLLDACYCYERWGATAKVRQLQKKYRELTESPAAQAWSIAAFTTMPQSSIPGTTDGTVEGFDLASVMDASRTISGEIVFKNLLVQLLRILMNKAGAQRGALIVKTNGGLSIEALGSVDEAAEYKLRSIPLTNSEHIPLKLVQRVFQTRETILLNDAPNEHYLIGQAYVERNHPKSLLCTPLVYHGQISAALYLENNLTSGAFSPDRLEILSLLGSQAAVSLENARLYDLLERRVAERTGELEKTNRDLKAEIVERERAQRALDEARMVAEEANRAKSDFLAAMSHELRTPLNAIIGFSELLETRYFGELNDDQSLYVRQIVTSGKHLLQLINDVLDLAKIEAGKLTLHLSAVSITNLLENSLSLFEDLAVKHGLELESRFEEELTDLEIQADEVKIKQIMYNLLSNAVKYTPPGGSVTVRAGHHEKGILISVIDTGVGIDPGDAERVFRAFEKADPSVSGKQIGTGIGLTLTRRLVEAHGGRIWLESQGTGKGSTFSFVIPEITQQTMQPGQTGVSGNDLPE